MVRYLVFFLVLAASALTGAPVAQAFQILPEVSDVDRKLGGLGDDGMLNWAGRLFVGKALPMVKSPVHESIVLAALDCEAERGDERSCLMREDVLAYRTLLYGVRWPDDPPFPLNRSDPPRIAGCDPKVTLRSTAQPACWKGLFSDARRAAAARAVSSAGSPAFGLGTYLL